MAGPWTTPGFQNWVDFTAGYDCIAKPCGENGCGTNPGSSHGRHGLDMRWLLRHEVTGDTVQFVVFTDWGPLADRDRHGLRAVSTSASRGELRVAESFPMAVDLGYHRTVPADYQPDEDASEFVTDCAYTPTGRCSYDGSGLNAIPVLALLAESGGDAVWNHLLDYHRSVRRYADWTCRIRVTGGPWPERHGAEGVIVDWKRNEYPWNGLGNAEVVILLDDDPLVPPERRYADWTCTINASDVEYLGPA